MAALGAGAYLLFLGDGEAGTADEALRGFHAAIEAGDCRKARTFADPSFPLDPCDPHARAVAGTLGQIRSTEVRGNTAAIVAELTVEGLRDERLIGARQDSGGWVLVSRTACYPDEAGPGEPPIFGGHGGTPLALGTIYDSEQDPQATIHNMRHGAVVFWVNGLSKDLLERVGEGARALLNEGYSDILVVPLSGMAVPFAMTAWGHRQRCVGIDLNLMSEFAATKYASGPEGAVACHHDELSVALGQSNPTTRALPRCRELARKNG